MNIRLKLVWSIQNISLIYSYWFIIDSSFPLTLDLSSRNKRQKDISVSNSPGKSRDSAVLSAAVGGLLQRAGID